LLFRDFDHCPGHHHGRIRLPLREVRLTFLY
jgi:hypothetical protein